jgi:hypothetical protein
MPKERRIASSIFIFDQMEIWAFCWKSGLSAIAKHISLAHANAGFSGFCGL